MTKTQTVRRNDGKCQHAGCNDKAARLVTMRPKANRPYERPDVKELCNGHAVALRWSGLTASK